MTPLMEDPGQRILGAALDGLWPHFLDADELVSLLAPVHHDAHFGMYQRFQLRLREELTPDVAVAFVRRASLDGSPHGLDKVLEASLEMAWPAMQRAQDLVTFARVRAGLVRDVHRRCLVC